MASKSLRGNTAIWAARPEAFTPTEWLSGLSAAKWATGIAANLIVRISPAVEDSFSLNATGSATDSSQSVEDKAEIETPTFREYEASLDLFRNKPGSTDTPIYDVALALFDAVDVPYVLVKRVDKAADAIVEVGDILSTYGVMTDYGQDIPDDGSMLIFGARFKTTGVSAPNKTVIA